MKRNCSVDESKGARKIETGQRSPRRLFARKVLLIIEVVAIVALLAAGFYLWQVRQTLGDEIRWAQQAEAAINAQATAVHLEAPGPVNEAPAVGATGTSPLQAQVQRVRIPAAGINYRLLPEAIQRMPASIGGGLVETLFLVLPVDVYGEGVCWLDRLQLGDSVYLEAGHQVFSFQVSGNRQSWRGDAPRHHPPVMLAGFPCGGQGERLFVSATPVSD